MSKKCHNKDNEVCPDMDDCRHRVYSCCWASVLSFLRIFDTNNPDIK